MSYRKERFRLRFRGLSEEVQQNIKDALPGIDAKQRGEIILFEIHQGVELEQLYLALDSLQLGPEQIEVLASVVTTSDNGGIDLPEHILELVRRTRCAVGFSFISTGPDETREDHKVSKGTA